VLGLVLISISSFLGIDNGITVPVPVPFYAIGLMGSVHRRTPCHAFALAAENPDMAFHGYVGSTFAEE
jgi:hypothetical protein